MTDYYKIADTKDFIDKKIRSYSLFGKKIGIVKDKDNTFFAIEIACKHQGADLTKGAIVNYVATCYRHKWKYDLLTGECLNHDSPPLRRYPLVIEGDDIKISPFPVD